MVEASSLKLTAGNAELRIKGLYRSLCAQEEDWDVAIIVGRINQYYFTGTMQDGIFVLRKDGAYAYFVRKSFLRAQDECLIEELYAIRSYKDAADFVGKAEAVYIDKDVATITVMERVQKAFGVNRFLQLDQLLHRVRAVKDEYELASIRQSGLLHGKMLDDVVPSLLKEGMSEAELMASIYKEMVALGHQGVLRFHMYQSEQVVGQIGFGDNSIYPTNFDGPGGMKGLSAAVPSSGSRSRTLVEGDLVFVDMGFGYNGYHTDRTQVYLYKGAPESHLAKTHGACLRIQQEAAALLKPGILASDVYEETVGTLDEGFKKNFMGLGDEAVRFLGHGVGLYIDEYPIITPGFDMMLENNMVIALEPKKSVPGMGTLGVEDTYIVTEDGGECVTGGQREIMSVW